MTATATKRTPYPEYKPSGIDWLGDVPSHWGTRKLKQVAVVSPRITLDYGSGVSYWVPFLPMDSLSTDGSMQFDQKRRITEVVSGFTRFEEGDFLLAKITPCFENGKAGLVRELPDQVGFGSTEYHVVRADSAYVDREFVAHLLRSGWFREIGEEHMTGSAGQKRVPTDFVKNFSIPLPPLDEQRAIADYLDRKDEQITRFIASRRRMIALLEEKKQAIINQAVTKGLDPSVPMKDSGVEWLGEIPAHWEVQRIPGLFRYMKGCNAAQLTREFIGNIPGEHPVYSGQTENEGIVGRISEFEFDFDDPVVLTTTVGAKAMTNRLVSGKFSLSQNCTLIVPRTTTMSIGFMINAFDILFEHARSRISLIMQPSLRFSDLNKWSLPVPPQAEQQALDYHISRISNLISNQTIRFEREITLIQEYRTRLISDVVTGKVRV